MFEDNLLLDEKELKKYTLTPNEKNYIFIRERNVTKRISTSDIIMIKSDSNYSTIFLSGGKEIFTSKTLKYWTTILINKTFIRTHASYLINSPYVEEINTHKRILHMVGNLEAMVSRQINIRKLINEIKVMPKNLKLNIIKNSVLLFIMLIGQFIFSQSVGIGTATPDSSAILDLTSTDKGFLIPRMDSLTRTQIGDPAQGLMVYQTNGNKGFYYHNGFFWLKIGGDGNEWTKNGANEIYTTKTIGIGNSNPDDYAMLDISSTEKGILIPRMSQSQRDAILNPDGGLIIYQTGANKGLYHFDGGDDTWKKVGDGPFSWTDGTGTVYTNNRVGIGNNNPNNSALLDLTSTSKGFLLPRMSTAQRDAISLPSQGLKIFNTDDRCEDTYDGQKWAKNCDMKQNGNATLNANKWRPRDDFPASTSTAKGFAINGLIYVYYNFAGNNFWAFNPSLNQWTPKANFPGSNRSYPVAFAIDTIGYLGLGGTNLQDFWAYNSNTNTWIQKNNFGGSGRSRAVGFSIGSKGYVGTGQISGTPQSDFWEYNPVSDVWTEKNSFDGGNRTNAIGFSVNGKGYLGTGYTGSVFTNDFWEYTPSATGGMGTWLAKDAVPGAISRQSAVGFSIGNYGYVGAGDSPDGWEKDFYQYYPEFNDWGQLEDIGGLGRFSAFGIGVGNKGYVGMGIGGQNFKDFWEYSTVSIPGKEYKEAIPADAISYIGHDWTSNGKALYTSNTGLDVRISGNTNIDGNTQVVGTLDIGYNSGVANSFVNINEENYEASLTNGGLLCIGNKDTFNIVIDGNEIQARDNSNANYLTIQPEGGSTYFGGNGYFDGSVAINSTGANAALYIKGLNNTNGRHIELVDDNSFESTFIFCNDNFIVKNTSSTGDFYFVNGSGPSDVNVLTMNASGNLTISGTTATKASGSSWVNPSDIRLKQNIDNYSSGLSDILKIRPVTFNYKSNPKENVVGVIAQELKQIAPYMVSESQNLAPDGTPYLQIDNSAMTYMLINAVKELAKQNEELKMRNEDLKMNNETEIKNLKAEMDNIKQLLSAKISIVKK